jgi:UDP-N-acetyl-D-mannosaminuronic acid dehydrogenase
VNAQTTVEAIYGSDATPDEQREALRSGAVPVGVYGLGKMGLPLAAVYAETTRNVTGADVDPDVVESVNQGRSHIVGEPGLDDLVSETVEAGALSAETDPAEVAADARLHVVIVPTLVEDQTPDLSIVRSVAEDIGAGLDPGDLVVFESTLPPRSCRDELLPVLEAESGLELGEFGLAFCPERTHSGRAIEDIRGAHPKIVGGADEESTRAAELVYGELSDNEIVAVSDTVTAEAVKVFEGLYRDVNIALANELATHADALEIDVTEAIDAANTQPFCDIHTPGAGVGGHCIPYYPYFLIEPFDVPTPLLETARAVNDGMPVHTAEQALSGLRDEGIDPSEATVLVAGLTYRAGVEETRKTPALPVVERLVESGATVQATDPILDDTGEFEAAGADIVAEPTDTEPDAVVLVTAHEEYEDLDVPALAGDGRLVLVDGRQAMTRFRGHEQIRYEGVGLHE